MFYGGALLRSFFYSLKTSPVNFAAKFASSRIPQPPSGRIHSLTMIEHLASIFHLAVGSQKGGLIPVELRLRKIFTSIH
jgi:hypothetical protein